VKTWTVPVTKAELDTQPDGTISITPSFDGVAGAPRTMPKDTLAPAAPTATPLAGTYRGAESVTPNKPAGETTSKIHFEIGTPPAAIREPDAGSTPYATQIGVSATQPSGRGSSTRPATSARSRTSRARSATRPPLQPA
jgi:hypothetical protein